MTTTTTTAMLVVAMFYAEWCVYVCVCSAMLLENTDGSIAKMPLLYNWLEKKYQLYKDYSLENVVMVEVVSFLVLERRQKRERKCNKKYVYKVAGDLPFPHSNTTFSSKNMTTFTFHLFSTTFYKLFPGIIFRVTTILSLSFFYFLSGCVPSSALGHP